MNEQENKEKRVQQFLEPGRKTSHGRMKIYQEFIEAREESFLQNQILAREPASVLVFQSPLKMYRINL